MKQRKSFPLDFLVCLPSMVRFVQLCRESNVQFGTVLLPYDGTGPNLLTDLEFLCKGSMSKFITLAYCVSEPLRSHKCQKGKAVNSATDLVQHLIQIINVGDQPIY
ncbi:hypothetical protein AVEN_59698-1 [Araneus ventricosus]|uniref:Uncharacterized protein n=1 Tax=Araneus ventricosus TaxID=182803 RepID=A0A4Y2BQN4_ARAVE|nr:hypothetical protein AVEN_59698-1 [Araneus ventricosus]